MLADVLYVLSTKGVFHLFTTVCMYYVCNTYSGVRQSCLDNSEEQAMIRSSLDVYR
jgi:hypothetical protein